MKKYYLQTALLFLLLACPGINALFAQENDAQLQAAILHQDSLFWQAYNACEVDKMAAFFTDDIEFYHDKGGATLGLQNLVESFKTGACSNIDSFSMRREAVEGSVKVFLLKKAGVVYGAIISGEHFFYVKLNGKKERLDGLAKFTHLWLLKDGVFKMARVLSYDHGPAPYINKRKEINLPAAILNAYMGAYKGPQTGTITVNADSGLLVLQAGNNTFSVYPEAANVFFIKERDLSFEFVKDSNNKVQKMVVRENGDIVEEAVFVR